MNDEWIKWFPANPPARQGGKLPVRIPSMRVSIAAIAEALVFKREDEARRSELTCFRSCYFQLPISTNGAQ